MSEIVTTVTGWIVNQGALDTYDEAYRITGNREDALADLSYEAMREDWARAKVAAAGKSWTTHMVKFDGTVMLREVEAVDWSEYRKCSQVCRAPMGEPCFSLSGTVVDGQTDGIRTELDHPHVFRKRRTRRAVR